MTLIDGLITLGIVGIGALFFAILGKRGGWFGIILAAIVWMVAAQIDGPIGSAATFAYQHSVGLLLSGATVAQ